MLALCGVCGPPSHPTKSTLVFAVFLPLNLNLTFPGPGLMRIRWHCQRRAQGPGRGRLLRQISAKGPHKFLQEMRVVVVLAVLSLALVPREATAVNSGAPVPASRGACVDYEAMGGSLCSGRIQHLVYFIPDAERSFEYLERAVLDTT